MQPTSYRIPFSAFATVLAIAPLCLAIACVDLLSGGHLRAILPRTPNGVFLYSLIFVIPHIVASFFSFADREYLAFYRRRLILELPLLALAALALFLFANSVAFILFIAYTEYHVISQLGGMGRFYFKARLPEYDAWRWVAIALSVLAYGLVYQGSLYPERFAMPYAAALGVFLCIPLLALAAMMHRRVRASRGRAYLVLMNASLLIEFLLIFLGYPVLSVFANRFIHDVPAFIAYVSHDHNRAAATGSNAFYRALSVFHLPVYVIAPAAAILIAFGTVHAPYIGGSLAFLLGVAHYYLEGFIWKNGSLHRAYIQFA